MSTAVDATTTSASTALRSSASRWKFWIVLVVLGLITALAMQMMDTDDAETYGLNNTDHDGYAALASVLEDEGVEIHQTSSAQGAEDLLEEHPEAGVVVLARDFLPGAEVMNQLRQHGEDTGNVLWMTDQTAMVAEALDGAVAPGPTLPGGGLGEPQEIEAEECPVPAGEQAESIQTSGGSFESDDGCFPVDGAEDAYVLAETSYGPAFAAPDAFTNQRIESGGNAALALSLFGASSEDGNADGGGQAEPGPLFDTDQASTSDPQLIWYTPSAADTADAQQWDSPLDYLPEWFFPLTWWLLLCAVLGMIIAGRRYGPVVAEPLPVSVPASESAHGRGRLYQQANAVPETAAALRNATILRLARALRLGPRPNIDTVVTAVAGTLGEDESRIASLLQPQQMTRNTELTSYAQQLASLESDVVDATRMRRRPVND